MKMARSWLAVACVWCGLEISASATEWYVATTGDDAAAGTSWEAAKATIQAGVDAAAVGDTVWVSNGVYDTGGGRAGIGTWPNRVTIDKAITVRSVNGAEATRIVGSGMRCAYVAEGATLVGFMLTNGTTITQADYPTENDNGGGAYCAGGVLEQCILTSNRARYFGGGVFGGTLSYCILRGNRARSSGGGAHGSALNNCLIVDNTASYGSGAIHAVLTHCTVVENKGADYGIGMCKVTNSIVWSNGVNFVSSTIAFSCTSPDPGGTGIITNDPRFVNAGAGDYRLGADSPCIGAGNNGQALWATDLDGNPRIDNGLVDMGAYEVQGNPLSILPGRVDVAGRASVGQQIEVRACADWSASTSVPWLSITSGSAGATNGTVEFDVETCPFVGGARTGAVVVSGGGLSLSCTVVQAGFSPILSVVPARIHLSSGEIYGQTVQVTANLPWTAVANEDWLVIQAGESGTADGQVEFSVGAYSASEGTRTGTVVIAGGGLVRTCTVVQAGTWWQARTWYVATNGNDLADGTSWATAKATIQAGVDAAEEDDTVWVSNGVYATGGGRVAAGASNRVCLDKIVAVISVNGAEATHIVGDGMRCVYMKEGARLVGFMLTNGTATAGAGYTASTSGGGAYSEAGELERCILTGNRAYTGGGVYGGILNHCILRGNTADNGGGGGAFLSTLNNCLLERNAGGLGSAVCRAILNHCTVVGHSAPAAVESRCSIRNSIVYSNELNYVDFLNTCDFSYSCTTPRPAGPENFSADPQFMDAAGGDYRLQPSSPCIDAGDNGFVGWNEDLDGNPRIAYGLTDVGAYEVQLAGAGTWFGAITNGLTNDLDCAAGDQTPNLMKYAMGGSPRQPQDRMFVEGVFKTGSGPKLTFFRNRNATDVRFIVESAESMTNGALWRGVATNVDGSWGGATNVEESGTGNPVECTVTAPEAGTTDCFLRLRVLRSAWDDGYEDLGGGWRRLGWFGDYIPTGGGWIWHNRLGSLRVTAISTPDDIWMYADDMGWLWTSRTKFPYFFRKSDGAWLWYNGTTNPRWFMNFASGQWESWK